nr:uncharacterized protein LOC129416211 [Misgurnus anguillicaudatus]XP_055026475.1 uncharacterized protein LOC129416211 [Misgurnus anguillicaudatus]
MDPTLTKMILELASPATKASISLDHTKPKALKRPFDCIRRGKVKTVPDPQPPVSSSNPSSKDSSDLASQSKVVKGGPEEPTSLFEDYLRRKKDVEHHVMLPHSADQAHPDATDKASLPISKTRVSLEGTDAHVGQSKYPMPDVAKNSAAKVSKIPGPESAGQQRQKKTGKSSPKCLLPKGPGKKTKLTVLSKAMFLFSISLFIISLVVPLPVVIVLSLSACV